MGKSKRDSRGFTLIAALLLTLLLSAMAVGLLYLVNNEQRMGGNDLEGNLAYYGAESGIENLTAQLSQLYQSSQSPTATSIAALTAPANYPTAISGSNITSMIYTEPPITWPKSDANGNPAGTWDIVGSGSDQGMVATLISFNLQVTATRASSAGEATNNAAITPTGASVNLTRTVEVALLPAFEFGVFCDGDCDYFAGPPFNFGGRVHTNGNLFLAANGGPLTFTDKIAAVGQVIISQLENGTAAGPTAGSYNGSVYIPNASGGCPAAPTPGPGSGSNCLALTTGSWSGGFAPTVGTANTTTWPGVSQGTFKGFVENGATGATKLQLPFVNSSKVGAIDIIRKPTPGDSAQVSASRLYNEASIRILLADTEAELYPGETRSDSATQDIQIGTPFGNLGNATGYVTTTQTVPGGVPAIGNMYFATALKSTSTNDWAAQAPTGCTSTLASWPLFGQVTVSGSQCKGAWLRVEYCPTTATNCGTNPTSWVGLTTQWLGYGFGRNYNQPPTHPYNSSVTTAPLCKNFPNYPAAQCQNGISPAILILQQLQEPVATSGAMESDTTDSSGTASHWLPLNLYDAREGEPRDARPSGDPGGTGGANPNCSPVGIMNAVELDVGNLWLWLQGSTPYSGGSGKKVNASTYNGYILYFSDRRGMLPDLYPLTTFYAPGLSGMSGLNDIVNSGSAVGVPDGNLEAMSYYATITSTTPVPYSPEDTAVKGTTVNGGKVDKWGETNLGAGFGITNTTNMALPYYIYGSVTASAVRCSSYNSGYAANGVATAEWNMVTGPRHVLRLVDGGMDSAGNSFVPPTGGTLTANGNGFTVASEEPVYVWGDYNTGVKDPFWTVSPQGSDGTTPHSAASIIADAVTLLSNPPATNTAPTTNTGWTDYESFEYPGCAAKTGNCTVGRYGNTSYYRVAIIAGKSIPFPNPSWSTEADFGTDGGMHNFLRYLEDRSDNGNGAVVNYAGSMISMYYSQYATGNFKCCTSVYGAPNRNYFFDTQFLNPANLPPGTPMFQDVVSLGFHQNFTPQ
ncbi:MAG: PilX N-terminal domain-containing pilus assembly protein [Candidatus Sulfotelmatobacter sp.]